MSCALGLLPALPAAAAEPSILMPLPAAGQPLPPPWHVAGLPKQFKPFTRFAVVDVDSRRALRIDAESSYGNLVHPLRLVRPAVHLSWAWRVDEPIARADLRTKEGDDTAVKVCAFFDLPLAQVPFMERQLLRLARSQSSEPLPAATVCYVWDRHLPAGTLLRNAFTPRMRYIVLQSGPAQPHEWRTELRDLAIDFMKLFGDEARQPPPLVGVAIGADADNTRGRSVAHVADLVLEP
jgi:hypothetical protein